MMVVPTTILFGSLLSLFTFTDLSEKPILIFSVLFIITLILISLSSFKLPESPRYLALSGSTDASLAVLFRLRHDMGQAAHELAAINECCRGETRGIEFFLQNTTYRRLLAFLCITTFLFNAGGVIVIPHTLIDNLSLMLFCPEDNLCYFTFNKVLIYGAFFVCFASLALHTLAIERTSRRTVILISTFLSIICLVTATLLCFLPDSNLLRWLITIALLSYTFFSFGAFVCFVGVIVVELLPTRGREFGVAAVFLAHGIGVLFGLQSNMPLVHNFGFFGFFAICAAFSAVVFYLLRHFLPDPGIQSLEMTEMRITSAPSFSRITPHNP